MRCFWVVYSVAVVFLAQGCMAQAAGQTAKSGTPAAGQDAAQTYTLHSTARLVVLDAVVTDKQGNLAMNLGKDDFHVTEAGEPQTILNFEQAGTHGLPPDVTIHSTAELDRLAPRAAVDIVVMDEYTTSSTDMAFAEYSLKEFLKRQPDKLPVPTMLVAVNLNHFTVLRDYTQSKQDLTDALKKHVGAVQFQTTSVGWLAEQYAAAFQTLMRVAQATEGHVGHKNMIWIGRGFPRATIPIMPMDAQSRVDSIAQDTINLLRDARVTLYTVDPQGISVYGPPSTMPYGAVDDLFGGNYQFAKIAKATGGTALYGRNDVDMEIGRSIRDGSNFYTLAYRPANASVDPAKFRKIKVTIDRPGLTVTTREGYFVERPPSDSNPVTPARRLAVDLLAAESSTMVYSAVPVTIAVDSKAPGSAMIHVDASALTWSEATATEPRRTDIVLMVCEFDSKGKELKRDARSLKFKAPAEVPAVGELNRPLNIPYTVEAIPGATRVRVVVRVDASGKVGTADLDLAGRAANGR